MLAVPGSQHLLGWALGVPEQVCQAVLHSLRVTPVSACVRV
eukprot:COSAG06_NODE_52620_length_304_cov_1.497561_1_plen_40_part_10